MDQTFFRDREKIYADFVTLLADRHKIKIDIVTTKRELAFDLVFQHLPQIIIRCLRQEELLDYRLLLGNADIQRVFARTKMRQEAYNRLPQSPFTGIGLGSSTDLSHVFRNSP